MQVTFPMGIQFFLKFLVVLSQVIISKCLRWIVDYQQQFFLTRSVDTSNTYVIGNSKRQHFKFE